LLREEYLTKFRIVDRTLLDGTVGCFSTFLQTVYIDSDMIQGINRIERKNEEYWYV
jgi:hypothetical protein